MQRLPKSSRCSSRRRFSSTKPRARCASIGGASISIRPSSRASSSGSPRSTTSRASTGCARMRCTRCSQRSQSAWRQLSEAADADALARARGRRGARYDALAAALSAKRATAANELGRRVTATMQDLAMEGGRFDVALEPTPSRGELWPRDRRRSASRRIRSSRSAPLSRVASGGELSRVALAIHVAASDVGAVPTLVFDEVDAGIGGAVAATVGRMLQTLGRASPGAVRHASAAGRGARRPSFPGREARERRTGHERARRRWRKPRASTSSRECSRAAKSRRRPARTRASSTSSIGATSGSEAARARAPAQR